MDFYSTSEEEPTFEFQAGQKIAIKVFSIISLIVFVVIFFFAIHNLIS